MKCNSSSYNCVLFIKFYLIFDTIKQIQISKKIQRALGNVLAGTFLPRATPDLKEHRVNYLTRGKYQ